MCGFIGCFPNDDPKIIKNGLSQISHRGPDAFRVKDTQNGTLGHARLSILDTVDGHQPMSDGTRWIVFNGEIYNYVQLRDELGGNYSTQGDTEVILRCYAERGTNCPKYLNGMFAFAIIDGDQLFLARDPMGIKPLYFVDLEGTILFASEIKALLPYAAKVQEFPAGFSWHSEEGFQRFFHIERPNSGCYQSNPEGLRKILREIQNRLFIAVSRRLIADPHVNIGISLSGGLDSSIIAALARFSRGQIDTFAVGMKGSDDLSAAQVMANYLSSRHYSYTYTFDEMLRCLPKIIYHLESFDAALVRSAIPNYFLAKLASERVKVILTGEGADELFGGYEYLRRIIDLNSLNNELWTITSNLHNTNLQRTDRMMMAHGIEGRVPFLDLDLIELAFQIPPQWKSPWFDGIEKGLLRRAFSNFLPASIVWRTKQKYSKGSGSADLMATYAHQTVSDEEYSAEKKANGGVEIRSKEELMYYRIFQEIFGKDIHSEVIGRTRSVTREELN